jgi:hypothetical protein
MIAETVTVHGHGGDAIAGCLARPIEAVLASAGDLVSP